MDPVAPVQISVAVNQFGIIALKVANTLSTHSEHSALQVPTNLKQVSSQLVLLKHCLDTIAARLVKNDLVDGNDLKVQLLARISHLTASCEGLDRLFDEFPALRDAESKTVHESLARLSVDERVRNIANGLTQNAPILQLCLTLVKRHLNGSIAASPPCCVGQPQEGIVLAHVPRSQQAQTFVQRGDLLDRIDDALVASRIRTDTTTNTVVLQGMRGRGKTQLALRYCLQSKEVAKYAGIFWVDSSDSITVHNSFAIIADMLGPDKVFLDYESRVRFVKSALESWTLPWLIIFDNYASDGEYALSEFVPKSPHGSCLVTSCNVDVSCLGELIPVPAMTDEQALKLLLSGYVLSEDEEATVAKDGRKIVQRLGRLPLAIAQANAYMRDQNGMLQLDEFLARFEQSTQDSLVPALDTSLVLSDMVMNSAGATIRVPFTLANLLIDLLEGSPQGQLKVEFLSLLGYFSTVDISEELFRDFYEYIRGTSNIPSWIDLFVGEDSAWSTEAFEILALELQSLFLVSGVARPQQSEGDGKMDACVHMSMHRLISDSIVLRLKPMAKEAAFQSAAEILASSVLRHYFRINNTCDGGFKLTVDERIAYMAHVSTWDKNFRGSERKYPTILKHAPRRTFSVEDIFAGFYADSRYFARASFLYEWVWATPARLDISFEDIRAAAGNDLADTLVLQGCLDASTERGRANLQYWQQCNASKQIINDTKFNLSQSLSDAPDGASHTEAIDLLRNLVEDADLPVDTRHAYLAELCQVSGLDRHTSKTDEQPERESIAAAVFSESEDAGGANYRAGHWGLRQWAAILYRHPDLEVRESLARESVRAMESRYGTHHIWCFYARLCVSDILSQRGKYDEAMEIYNSQLYVFEQAVWEYSLYPWAFASLADAFKAQGKHEDIIAKAIEFLGRRDSYPVSGTRHLREVWQAAAWMSPAYRELRKWEEEDEVIALMLLTALNVPWDDPKSEALLMDVFADASRAMVRTSEERKGWRECLVRGMDYLEPLLQLYQAKASSSIPLSYGGCHRHSMAWLQQPIRGVSAFMYGTWKAMGMMHLSGLNEAIQHLQNVMDMFDGLETYDEDPKLFLSWCLSFWNWATLPSLNLQPESATAGIQWACDQARRQMGDRMSTREWVRKELLRFKDLRQYHPRDEPYLEGLYPPQLPQEAEDYDGEKDNSGNSKERYVDAAVGIDEVFEVPTQSTIVDRTG
jgi:tetratricopeptide (TPR) repeat protein